MKARIPCRFRLALLAVLVVSSLQTKGQVTNCCDGCAAPYPASYAVTVLAGFNYLVNHLCHGTSNLLNEVLPNVSAGTLVTKWNKAAQLFGEASTYVVGVGWVDSNFDPSTEILPPGEGFLLFNPGAAFMITFTGCVPNCGPPCEPMSGFSLVGRIGIGTATYSNLFSCPPVCGTRVRIWNPTNQVFSDFDYLNGVWTPQEPVLTVGASAFVSVLENTNCLPPCLRISNEQLTCATNAPGKLNYSFPFQNNTAVPVTYLFLVPKTNCFTFMPDTFTFNPPVLPGQTAPVNVMINVSSNCPTNLCFLIAAHDSNFVQCCSIMHCVQRIDCAEDLPRMRIRLGNGQIIIDWTGGGQLQCASQITGPWADVAGATSPYTTPASGAQKFYRIRRP